MWQDALQRVLDEWEGTPWRAGQCLKGHGVDCVRFVDAVLSELHNVAPAGNEGRCSQDLAYHSQGESSATMRYFLKRYPNTRLLGDFDLEPGDIIIVRRGQGPGHVLIVGKDSRKLWHSTNNRGVCFTSLKALNAEVIGAWRCTHRQDWR